jgi:hypothetical protein
MYQVWPDNLKTSADVVTATGRKYRKIEATLKDLGEDPLQDLVCDSWWAESKSGVVSVTFGVVSPESQAAWVSRFGLVGLSRDALFTFREHKLRLHRPVLVDKTRSTVTFCFLEKPSDLTEHGNLVLV